MKTPAKTFGIAVLALGLGIGAASAQGIVRGTADGAAAGGAAAGPVGAAVGGVVGGVTGAVGGLLGVDQRPAFRDYVVREHRSSFRYAQPVAVGAVLPATGVEYYEVPAQYGVQGYRYTIVNDAPVLVDPATRRIVQIID